jgi:hypothetical protein
MSSRLTIRLLLMAFMASSRRTSGDVKGAAPLRALLI